MKRIKKIKYKLCKKEELDNLQNVFLLIIKKVNELTDAINFLLDNKKV